MDDKHAKVRDFFEEKAKRAEQAKQHELTLARLNDLSNTFESSFGALIKYLRGATTKTELVNQLDTINTPDVDKVVKAVEGLDETVQANKLDLTELEKTMTDVLEQLKQVPKEHPEAPEAVEEMKVTNLSDIDFKPFVDAISKLELKAETPTVNVDAPIVKVDAPDLKPVQKLFSDLLKAVKAIDMPDVKVEATDTTAIEKELKKQTEQLKKLLEKKTSGGGGGGGNGTPYIDSTGKPVNVLLNPDGSIPVSTSDTVTNYSLIQFDDTSSASYEYYAYMDSSANWYIKRLTLATNLFEFTAPVATSYSAGWTGRAGLSYVSKGAAF